jgi:hypothetical protein
MSPAGRVLALLLVLLVTAAVVGPVLIVGREYGMLRRRGGASCPSCGLGRHAADARYCKHCGGALVRTGEGVDHLHPGGPTSATATATTTSRSADDAVTRA